MSASTNEHGREGSQPCCGVDAPVTLVAHRTLLKNRKLFESYGMVIPPATTPPVVLAALQARVLSQTGETRNKIKTTCQ